MSKKVLSFLVTLSLLVSQVFCVVAEDTNGILWNYDEASGTLTVSGTGDMEDFSDSSDAPWYINKSGITAVIVEDGVTSVGDNAFSSYTALKTVHIGKDVVSIGNYAFESCRMLGKVTFGDESALQTIGRSAFEYCGGLTSFTVPENVSKINSYCFDSCYSLAEVYNKSSLDIQAGKTSNGFIAYFAQNVYKPESGASILTETEDGVYMNIDGEGCFLKASDKVNVDVASSYTDANGNTVVVKSIYSNAFYGRYDIKSVNIAQGIKDIGESAFYGCTALENIVIPSTVVKIGAKAFSLCSKLETVEFAENSELVSISTQAFFNCRNLDNVVLPEGVNEIGVMAFANASSLTNVTFNGDAPESFGVNVFNGCASDFSISYYKWQKNWSTPEWNGYPCAPLDVECTHEGGTATCHSKAICDICGEEYGEVDPENHDGETTVNGASDAVCGTPGYTGDKICLGCNGVIEQGEEIPALTHEGGTATCHSKAICDHCGEEYGEVDPENHDGETTVNGASDAVCGTPGYTGDKICLGCNGVIEQGEEIPALTHEGGMATCHSKAICDHCGEEYGEIDPANHDGETAVNGASDAVCGTPGYTGDKICLGCNGVIEQGEEIPALTHEGGMATCHSKAICDHCGEEYGEIDPANHDGETAVNGASDAVCGTPGYTGDKICLGCNGVIEQGEEIPALTHEGGTATCHSKAICDHCGEEYGEIDSKNHDGGTETKSKDADCGNNGYINGVFCLGCGHMIAVEEVLPATGLHEGGTATCHSKAICIHCEEEYGEIAPGNHDGETKIINAVSASCGVAGYTGDTVCLGCENVINYGKEIPALTHEGGTATCHSGAICIHCEKEYGEFNTNNHDGGTELRYASDASCGVAGYTGDTVCLGCETVLNYGEEIPALTHEGGTATCHSKAICIHCEKEYGEIAPENHDGATEIINTLDASCGVAGYTGDTVCLGCETVLNYGEEIPALTHEGGTATCHSKAICIHCEKEYGEIAPGNHDGATEIINTLDASCGVAGYTGDTLCHGCENVINYGKEIPALTHEGGTATCHSKAICIHCEKEYGEFNTNNHNGGTELRYASDASCGVAGYTGDTVCLGCEMVTEHGKVIPAFTHEGGTATCHSKAICIHCEKEYGEIAPNNHNGEIEIIGIVEASCGVVGYTGDTFCHGCETVIFYGSQTPALVHEGGTATCHSKAICIHCEKEYGEVDLSNHDGETEIVGAEDATPEKNGYTGDVCCTGCGEVIEYGKVIYMGASEGFTTVYKNEAVFNATLYDGELPEDIKDGKAYTVYFTDENGEYISVEWLNMAYTLPYDSYSTVKVYKLGEDGTYEEADVEICNNRIVFNAFENGVYVIVTATLSGDANCDGIVNGKDVVRIKKYMENTETIIAKSADVNGDGDINEVDISLIVDMITAA